MAKTVLLAGASGLVGSNILVELKKTNARLISLARTKLCTNDGIEEIICDFDHVDKLESEIIFDEVYIAIGSKLELYELLYLKKSRRDDFKKIDLEFIKNVAFFAKKNGAKSIGLVSAVGANHKSSNTYLNIKGKTEREIISLGRKDINPRKLTGERISPQDLKNLLDNKEDVLVLDTRNEYETRVGKFKNAIDLNLDTFRDFPKAIETLPEEYKDKQIVMYCTGGIRCEKASAVMIKAGFADVKQLEGGVLDYFKETGGAYWEGDSFGFDQRMALDTNLNETEYIYCSTSREPLSDEEKASSDFRINEYCPYCIKK